MYKIRGGDGNEYGPVSADQVKQWISEGRANSQTLVLPDGLTEWKPIGSLPEFAGIFTAPPLPPLAPAATVSPGGALAASQQVQGPAVGLMITAIIGLVGAVGMLFSHVFNLGVTHFESLQNPELEKVLAATSGVAGVFSNLIGITAGVIVLIGAIKMKGLTNYGLSMAAAILAMLPCVSPCCCLGIPIGIWALIVLMKPEIKNAFV